MKMSECMVWWNDADEHEDENKPQVKVLKRLAKDNGKYFYLSNSVGACFLGWEKASPHNLAAYLLGIFNQMVCSGVSVDAAHAEYMNIDEYADWKSNGSGPFADLNWSWAA